MDGYVFIIDLFFTSHNRNDVAYISYEVAREHNDEPHKKWM